MQENNFLQNKTLPEKLYLGGFVLGIISLFLPWVDFRFASVSGFQQEGYIFLIPMLYPIITLFTGKTRHGILNLVLAIITLAGSVCFMFSKIQTIFGTTINATGSGLYLMIVAAIVILVGSIMEMKK